MSIIKIKPTTPGRRGMTVSGFDEITKKKPEKSLVVALKRKGGRNAQGKLTVRHQGGGAKRKYRLVDFKQVRDGMTKVVAIEYDPNRSANIALLEDEKGEKFYILAPEDIKTGEQIGFGKSAKVASGHRMLLGKIPVGTFVYNIEISPGKGGQIVRSAGGSAQIVGREEQYIHVKLPSKEIKRVLSSCYANIGIVGNAEHFLIKFGKAGRKRHMGIRPTVRGKAMNPVDHPHGGGEGSNSIGLVHPKTPWGAPALGYVTRKRKHRTNYLIVRKRRK